MVRVAWNCPPWLASGAAIENGVGHEPPPPVPPPSPPDLRERNGRLRHFAFAAIVAAVGLLGLLAGRTLTREAGGAPIALAIAGNDLRAVDASGRISWTHRIDSGTVAPPPTRWSHVGDLNADGVDEIFVSVEIRPPQSSEEAGQLLSLTPDGDVRWSSVADDRFRFGDGEYGPPWPASDLAVYRLGGEPRIAWSLHHFTWWPSMLLTLDASGKRLGTFVNGGWIHATAPSPDGRRLFVTGVSNSRRAYFLAVLDAERPSGRSPELAGSAMECMNCPDEGPLQYFVFPRTDVSMAQPFPGNGPTVMIFEDGTVQVHVLESGSPNFAATIYDVNSDPGIGEARFSDSYWEWHRRLETEGRIDHTAEACLERRGLDVQRWTPQDGWHALRVAVR